MSVDYITASHSEMVTGYAGCGGFTVLLAWVAFRIISIGPRVDRILFCGFLLG